MLKFSPIRAADLRAYNRMAIDATIAVTDLLENMHHNITRLPGVLGTASEEPARGITGFVYRCVRGITRQVGNGVDLVLRKVTPSELPADSSTQREILVSALNGLVGDYLSQTDNPLQIRMSFRREGVPLTLERDALGKAIPDAKGKIVVLAHGLCMNDLQWNRRGHDHGKALSVDGGFTPVYLHYNSGLHVSTNGREFSELLEALLQAWPVPVEQITIIGYSMGGLIARSACEHARRAKFAWLKSLREIVFIGTPHYGSPLERNGNKLDALLGASPYTAALSRLGKVRSAGITDLRHAYLDDADWRDHDRFKPKSVKHDVLPLPRGVRCFAIAGSISKKSGSLSERLAGDGLVPLYSALGMHRDRKRNLGLPESRRWIGYKTSHLGLLSNQDAYMRIRDWLLSENDGSPSRQETA